MMKKSIWKKAVAVGAAAAMTISVGGSLVWAEGGDKKTINIFTLYSESNSDAGAAYFREALAEAQEAFPDYELVHETADVETYKTKIKAMVAADEVPDIFFAWGAGFVKPFVDAGKVMALDEYMDEETNSRLLAGANDEFLFDGKTYGLTSYKWIGALYCNTELFEKYEVKIPETYEELMTACKTFREAGLNPMVVGMKDKWPGQQYLNEFTVQLAGSEETNKMASKETSFDNEYLAKAAQLTKDLVDAGAFNDGALGLTRDESEAAFLQGEVPMNFTGSWFSELTSGENSKVDGKVTAVRFPVVEECKDVNNFFGGAINGLCVAADCEYPEETAEVCKFLAEHSAIADGGLVTWEVPEEAKASVHSLNQEIIEFSKDAAGYSLAWDTLLEAADAQEWLNLVAQLFGGEVESGEAFAKTLQDTIG
ncbi:MAG: extracellular solute-binding protein [Eubacteriales bacterium]|nr:extracellular solute-binding protein [Eubacteriales bacterium]